MFDQLLIILPKISGVASFSGSTFIVYDYIMNRRKDKATYFRLLLAISIIDVLTSAAYFSGTWAMPRLDDEGNDIAARYGNMITCKIQSLIIQFGIASPFYNLSLAIYYQLVVAQNWQQSRIRKIEPYLHIFPLSFGLITTLIALTSNEDISDDGLNFFCWFNNPNNQAYLIGLFYGPLCICIILVTGLMWSLYRAVLRIESASYKYSVRNISKSTKHKKNRKSKMAYQVLWQAIFFVGAFFLTWTFPIIVRSIQIVNKSARGVPQSLLICMAVTLPLQGFWHFAHYIRPRCTRYRQKNPDAKIFCCCYLLSYTIQTIKLLLLNCGCCKKAESIVGGDNEINTTADIVDNNNNAFAENENQEIVSSSSNKMVTFVSDPAIAFQRQSTGNSFFRFSSKSRDISSQRQSTTENSSFRFSSKSSSSSCNMGSTHMQTQSNSFRHSGTKQQYATGVRSTIMQKSICNITLSNIEEELEGCEKDIDSDDESDDDSIYFSSIEDPASSFTSCYSRDVSYVSSYVSRFSKDSLCMDQEFRQSSIPEVSEEFEAEIRGSTSSISIKQQDGEYINDIEEQPNNDKRDSIPEVSKEKEEKERRESTSSISIKQQDGEYIDDIEEQPNNGKCDSIPEVSKEKEEKKKY